MENELSTNNLFGYATSELSQDAFICWLLSFAMEENWNIDPQLRECAVVFINQFYRMHACDRVTAIRRQYNKIDVLIEIGDTYVVIEDKTFSVTHDDQINKYKQSLKDTGISEDKIICVYYKIIEQPTPEPDADFEFTREKLLKIFTVYKNFTDNIIFKNYVEYLEWIDRDIKSFAFKPISEWADGRAYIGFFTKLINEKLLDALWYGWGHVNNAAGGFWGLWWYLLDNRQLNDAGITEEIADELYLQIENDQITVKISLSEEIEYDMDLVGRLRRELFEYFRKEVGAEFRKKTFRNGRVITVGYITYDENNYSEKILLMQDAMLGIADGKFVFAKK